MPEDRLARTVSDDAAAIRRENAAKGEKQAEAEGKTPAPATASERDGERRA